MSSTSVFFVLGAQQAVAVPLILAAQPSAGSLILRLSGIPLQLPQPCDCEEIVLPQSAAGLATLRVYRHAIRRLRQLRAAHAGLDVYVPHTFHALANFAAIGLGANRVHLLPDGALNYYDPQVDAPRRRQMRLKQAVMALCGGAYQRYRGSLTGAAAVAFASTYTFDDTGLVTRHGTVRRLQLPSVTLADGDDVVLFVDQPLDNLQRDLRRELEAQVSAYLAGRRVLYKAHASQDRPSVPMPDDVEVLPRERPVETLLGDLHFSEVVSVSSSALLTLKQLNPGLRCTAVGIVELASHKPELEKLRDAMQHAGIRCL